MHRKDTGGITNLVTLYALKESFTSMHSCSPRHPEFFEEKETVDLTDVYILYIGGKWNQGLEFLQHKYSNVVKL